MLESLVLPSSATASLGSGGNGGGVGSGRPGQASSPLSQFPVEFITNLDKMAAPAGGPPLTPDPGAVLFTLPPDAPGPPRPFTGLDFGPDEIDALANRQDLYYREMVRNHHALSVSFEGDSANAAGDRIATHVEYPSGNWDTGFRHRDLHADAWQDPLEEVDGIEYWGPRNAHDADVFSVENDATTGGGWSVYIGGNPYLEHGRVVAAVTNLGYNGPAEDVDVDGLFVNDSGDGVWSQGDELLFSIRPAGNWTGVEIVRLLNTGVGEIASFLSHGGHLWDTNYRPPVGGSQNVDAIEATPPAGGSDYLMLPFAPDDPAATAHGLVVVLEGRHSILAHFDGDRTRMTLGQFESFEVIQGTHTELRWSNWDRQGHDTIYPDQLVEVGWTTLAPHAVRDVYWIDAELWRVDYAPPVIVKCGGDPTPEGDLALEWTNRSNPAGSAPAPVIISEVLYAILDEPLSLDQLTNPVVLLEPLPGGEEFTVEPGATVAVPLPEAVLPVLPGAAVVVRTLQRAEAGSAPAFDYHQFIANRDPGTPVITDTELDDDDFVVTFTASQQIPGWSVRGGASPGLLVDDMVGLGRCEVTETETPGVYKAVARRDEDAYFLRIEPLEFPGPLVVGEVGGPTQIVAGTTTRHHLQIGGGNMPYSVRAPMEITAAGTTYQTIETESFAAAFDVNWEAGLRVPSGSEPVTVTDAWGRQRSVSMSFEVWGDDTDGDDLPDAWETAVGLDPTDSEGDNGGSGDPDFDGIPNYEEFLNGTDPFVPDF